MLFFLFEGNSFLWHSNYVHIVKIVLISKWSINSNNISYLMAVLSSDRWSLEDVPSGPEDPWSYPESECCATPQWPHRSLQGGCCLRLVRCWVWPTWALPSPRMWVTPGWPSLPAQNWGSPGSSLTPPDPAHHWDPPECSSLLLSLASTPTAHWQKKSSETRGLFQSFIFTSFLLPIFYLKGGPKKRWTQGNCENMN